MTIASVTHIDAFGDPHLAPEALFISALIDTGNYLPDSYQVRDEHFQAHRPVHEFCKQHQHDAGKAPDIGIVRKRFTSFPYMPKIDPTWSARELKEHWQSRVLRKAMTSATMALAGEDFDVREAHTVLKEALDHANPSSSRFTSSTDYDVFANMEQEIQIPVTLNPLDKLNELTGGIRPGNLWYVAARLGIGKTWKLTEMAVAGAEAGYDVWFYSTEMTARECLDRVHRIALRNTFKEPWWKITLPQRMELMDAWQATAGTIKVIDPSVGAIDPTMIAGNHTEGSMAVVDYLGRMRTSAGARAVEDWRQAATVSNELKEIALTHGIPVVCAAQINREGAKSETPKAEHLSQADAIGQDADVLLTVTQMSQRVRVNSLTKNRHGAGGSKWFTMFDPDTGQFHDIDASRAEILKEQDADIANRSL